MNSFKQAIGSPGVAEMERRFPRFLHPLVLLLIGATLACAGCSSTSDLRTNPHAGTGHPLVRNAQAWPMQMREPGQPGGIWFRAKRTNARGTIVCLHGVQTHAGWFSPLAAALTRAGWNVVAPDRRGSGVNTAAPFKRGHAKNAGQLLDDLRRTMAEAKNLAPGKPVILLGTSWGSNLASTYCAKHAGPQPDLLVQLVPGTKTRFSPAAEFGMFLMRRAPFENVHYLPGRTQEKNVSPGPPDPEGEPPGNEFAARTGPVWRWLATDSDPRINMQTDKPSRATIWAGRRMTKPWQKPHSLPPTLVIVATRDQIMDNSAAITAVKKTAGPGRFKIRPIDAGHGAQISHADEIAGEILTWAQKWTR